MKRRFYKGLVHCVLTTTALSLGGYGANAARLSKLPYSRRQLCLRCGMETMAYLLQQVKGEEAPEFAFPFFLRSRQANMESHCNILDRSIL